MAVKDRTAPSDGAVAPEGNNAWDAAFAVGREFGDSLSPDSLPPEPAPGESESSAGQPPADVQPPRESTGDVEAPPVAVQPTEVPTPRPGEAPPVDDPLAGAEPFTYGETKTAVEGALRIPGDGLYVPEDRVPVIEQAFVQAQALARDLDTRTRQWERLTSHTVKDQTGAEQTLTGVQGLEAIRFEAAADKAALHSVVKVLSDPAAFAGLVDYVKIDAQGNQVHPDSEGPGIRWFPVRNEAAWSALVRDSSLSVRELKLKVRDQMQQLNAPPPPPEPSVSDMAMPTIEQVIAQHNIQGLTPADKQFLAGQFETYVRQSTPQERAQTGSARIVRDNFVALVKHQAALRADATKALTTGTKANTFNKGMEKGRVAPATGRSVAPQPLPTGRMAPKVKTESSANDQWANLVAEAVSGV